MIGSTAKMASGIRIQYAGEGHWNFSLRPNSVGYRGRARGWATAAMGSLLTLHQISVFVLGREDAHQDPAQAERPQEEDHRHRRRVAHLEADKGVVVEVGDDSVAGVEGTGEAGQRGGHLEDREA